MVGVGDDAPSVGEAFAIDKGGIIMRFTCSLELIAQLRPLGTTAGLASGTLSEAGTRKDDDAVCDEDNDEDVLLRQTPPAVPLVKTLSGELEAVVVPDESHHLFHGRRTVIRYCMLG